MPDDQYDTVANEHPYYDGLGFPLDRLSSDHFESFVFSCLLSIQDVLGLQITGKPSGSGDGGFDVQGRVLATGRLVCVQCKRQSSPLDMGQLAKELAKVAATSALEGSSIGEHRFICTGGVRKTVVSALRSNSRQEIANEAGQALQNAIDGELASLRTKLDRAGMSPRSVAASYVEKLDLLTAWNTQEFDAALSPRWEAVLEVAQRFFRIATVVRENTRACFDRTAYIAEFQHLGTTIEPRLVSTELPTGISIAAAVSVSTSKERSPPKIRSVEELVQLEPGDFVLLVGQGGVGKTTALKLVRAKALQTSPDDVLPIFISLAAYAPGALDRLIHQELGAKYGSWRALPDKVILLCDGLNECSRFDAATFLDELSPLLRRKRVSCILTSRESTKLNSIALPYRPLRCLEVQNITSVVIRRLAETELVPQDAAEFIRAYTSLAEGSGSQLLWTPFAVQVALRIWKLRSAVPTTLGEMIDVLLKSRSSRNAEFPQVGMPTSVLFQLASALAFQCVFVNKRLECPMSEAGKWIREAKERCNDSLGIEDLKDTEVVELLVSHELLRISDNGNIGFGHQLLAGSLSAAILAKSWGDHLDALRETVADDAWVFAARLVSTQESERFLRAILDVDLMLGARVARELPTDLQDLAIELLSKALLPEAPETFRHQSLYALARIGTSNAINRLKVAATDVSLEAEYSARRARAAAGDMAYLRNLLPEIDQLKSTPMKVSGGDVSIWEAAPLSARISLARERLSECVPGVPVGESLLLVAYERDRRDASIIERHVRAALDLSAFQIGLHSLQAIAPTKAKEIFDEELSEHIKPQDKARLIRVAAGIGIEIDTRLAFECAIATVVSDESESHPEFDLLRLIPDVLEKAEVPADILLAIERDLPNEITTRKARLWKVASKADSSSILQFALSCIEQWSPDRGYACDYLIERKEHLITQKQHLLELCERGLAERDNSYDWTTTKVFALVGVLGFTAKAAHSLSLMLERLDRVRHALEVNDYLSLSDSDRQLYDSIESEHKTIHLARFAAALIPAATEARRLLPTSNLLKFLSFDTHSFSGVIELQREMLSGVDDLSIDEVLVGITGRWARLSTLLIVSNRKPTSSRIQLLGTELQVSYAHPAALNVVRQAVENCWCNETLSMAVNTVASIPVWLEQDTQFFWSFFESVSNFLRIDDISVIDYAIANAKTAFALRILHLWREYASGERIGLARLPTSSEF